MPSNRVHCAISEKRTGEDFKDLHSWIDEYSMTLGVEHRQKRHFYNEEDKEYILKNWGEKGIIEWLFHIALDNLDTAYKMSLSPEIYGDKTFNFYRIGFARSGYIDMEFDSLSEEDLKEKFKIINENMWS